MTTWQNGVELRHQSSSSSSSANSTKDLISQHSDASLPEIHVTTQPSSDFDMSNGRRYVTVAVLTLVNLLNYMDRSTIAGKYSKNNQGTAISGNWLLFFYALLLCNCVYLIDCIWLFLLPWWVFLVDKLVTFKLSGWFWLWGWPIKALDILLSYILASFCVWKNSFKNSL